MTGSGVGMPDIVSKKLDADEELRYGSARRIEIIRSLSEER
jgi:hypothetical protein